MLSQGTSTVPVKMMEDGWRLRNGLYVRIDPFETHRGAEYYITKRVSADFSEGRFSFGFIRAAVRLGRMARMRTSPAKGSHFADIILPLMVEAGGTLVVPRGSERVRDPHSL